MRCKTGHFHGKIAAGLPVLEPHVPAIVKFLIGIAQAVIIEQIYQLLSSCSSNPSARCTSDTSSMDLSSRIIRLDHLIDRMNIRMSLLAGFCGKPLELGSRQEGQVACC